MESSTQFILFPCYYFHVIVCLSESYLIWQMLIILLATYSVIPGISEVQNRQKLQRDVTFDEDS